MPLDPEVGLSLAGLRPDEAAWSAGPRAAIEWASDAGFRAIQIDGAAPGTRARDLDRAARRDLAALLRRRDMRFCGVDLWIPEAHFADPARQERALAAAAGAIELGADLARLSPGPDGAVVCIRLPTSPPAAVHEALNAAADRCGVRVADYGDNPPPPEPGPLGIGVDPADCLLRGRDPAAAVASAGRRLSDVRLTDAGDTGRVPPLSSEGRLDPLALGAALSVIGWPRAVILDLRGLASQPAAALAGLRAWRSA